MNIPPAPAEDRVQLQFNALLHTVCTDPELRDELNAFTVVETKWACVFLSKLPSGSVSDGWLDPQECVELVHKDVKCVHDLLLAIRISILLRPGSWVEKFVAEKGIEALVAPLKVAGDASIETCNEILSALFVLVSNSIGIQAIVEIPESCSLIYSVFDSCPSNKVKARAIKLLGMLCRDSKLAQDAVMNIFSSTVPFQSLVSKLHQNQSDIALQLAVVKFMNSLLESTRGKKERASVCEGLKANGFLSLLESFKRRQEDVETSPSSLTSLMIAQIEMFYENYDEARKGDNLGALRLALGDALGTKRNGLRRPTLIAGNQGESEEICELARPEQEQSDAVPEDPKLIKKEEPEDISSSLDGIFSQLHQNSKNLDQETNEKLAKLLRKLAQTLSDKSGASKAVDRLDRSFSSAQSPNKEQTSPEANRGDSLETKSVQEPDLLTRVGMTLFPSLGDLPTSVAKPPLSGRPPLFSGFGDFSLASLSTAPSATSSVSKPSFTSFIGADRSMDSSGARGVKLSLPFFQSSRKGPSLGVTPACTPIATASVRKDAKRPVFPSFPSPPKEAQVVSASVPTAPPPAPVLKLPLIEIPPAIPALEVVKPLVIEPETSGISIAVQPPVTGTDISKFRKLLSMGAPREAVRAKMMQAGVNPDLLDEQQGFTPKASPKPVEKTLNVSKSVGVPPEAVKAKMRQAGLELSSLDQKEGNNENPAPTPTQETSSGPDIAKFKKLLAMGAPLAAVKAKMTQAGVDPVLLDGPSTFAPPPAKLKVKDDPNYAKFFKLLSMGAPPAAVKAKMAQAGLNGDLLDTPDADMPTTIPQPASKPETPTNSRALLSNMLASHTAPSKADDKVKDDPQYAKFFKLLSMGAPAASVKAKMQMAGLRPELLDTPDAPLKPASAPIPAQPEVKVKDDPAYAKFFKLQSMGAPAESVKAKMRMAGLNPDLLDTPEASLPNLNAPAAKAAVKVKNDPGYAKFFKLLSMGAPAESVKVKMQMAGLKPELLDTPDVDLPGENPAPTQPAQPQVKVKDDPAYAKFFKLLEMGAPAESVKAKMRMAGLQGDLLDTPDAFVPSAAPATQPAPTPAPPATRRANLTIAIKPVVKTKTRSFYWQQLKAEAIKGTIWEELEKEHSNQSNQDFLTLSENELTLLETEFPPPAACGPGTGSRLSGLASPGPASPLTSPRVVFLIDRARSNNISIIVKQFRMSNAALRVAIMKMDSEVLTLDRVQGLIKILPTEEEIAAVSGFSGDPTTLNGAELVLKELITVPRLKQRLSALETKHQFPAFVRDLQTKVNKIRMASNEIAQSSELKIILLVILQVGNKMNAGTARGGAKGFRLNDLTKLVQLKSTDKSVTLLHYVARMIRMKKSNVVRLGDSLASLYDVQSISIPELTGDMNRINDITENINVELAAQRLKNRIEVKEESDLFVESMTAFVDEASKDVATLKTDLDETLRLMRDIMLRFDKNTDEEGAPAPPVDAPVTTSTLAGAGEFFSIIYEFSMSLTKADRENELKRIREEKRLKQQELKSSVPRRGAADRAALIRANRKLGPEIPEVPRQKNIVAVASNLPDPAKIPADNTPDKTEVKPESSTPPLTESSNATPETDEVKSKEPAQVEEKDAPTTHKTALNVQTNIIKASALPPVPASPLKKVVGTIPTAIPSPLKAKRSPSVPFDAASLSEIKSQLKTKHANNEPQIVRGLKPEVETDGDDHDNNNNEPSSPQKALSEVEPSTRAVQADA
ncbi:Formin-like protein 20 [Phytophthora citrophthora]|uniref:Formin-like protein 20 n=1 Tax=Phytophthora citrophthora TaxID=4793 RepID=A0AAD9LK71_9STRA|nr:Formin-like protein 20 [Phytophthora citrophthora]